MPRKAVPPELQAERKRRSEQKVTSRTISRELKIATLAAYNMAGGVKYLYWLSQHKHAIFAELMKKCMGNDDSEGDTNITFVVQQITMQAKPVPGVLNSPIAGHIAGPQPNTEIIEVIDAELTRNG